MEASADESMYPGCIGDDDDEEEFDKTPSRLNTTEGDSLSYHFHINF